MFNTSGEELKSYERIRALSVEELIKNKQTGNQRASTEVKDISLGAKSIFLLPFEPVWYIPLMFTTALYCMLVLYESGPQDEFYNFNNMKVFYYSFDFVYALDVLLMMGCKFCHVVIPPIIRPTTRPKFILILELASVLPIELAVMTQYENGMHSQLFYYLRLNKVLRAPRIFYFFFYKQSMLQTNTSLKVMMLFFLNGLCMTASNSFTYHLICRTYGCDTGLNYQKHIFFSMTAVLTNHGFAYMPDNLIWEISAVIIGYFVFFLVFGICIGLIINDFTRSQTHKYAFKNKITVVKNDLITMNLSKEIVEAVCNFYSIFWKKRHGFNDNTDFFELIPYPMYQQIVLDVCWIPLKHSKLFKDMDLPFLRFISSFVKQKFMLKDQLIYQKNHLKHKMIFIASGVIQIISEQDGETPIMSLSAGTCLGESSLIISYKSRNTVRCKEYCEIHELDKKEFTYAIIKYTDRFRYLRSQICARYEAAREIHLLSKHFNVTSDAEGKDYFTITWIKNTLHKLMAKDDENKSKHDYQNIYLQYEMHEHKINSMLFSATNLDMLVITERLELDTDSIFLKSTWPFVLQPDSLFQYCWEGFIVVLTFYSAFIIPYYSLIASTTPLLINVSFHCITVIWILDFCIQIFTAVKTKDGLVTEIKAIFAYKLQSTGFVADIVSWIPVEIFSRILFSKMNDQNVAILQANRLVKIWRFVRMFYNWENQLHSNIIYVGYLKFLCLLTYIVFLIACFLYGYNCNIQGQCDYYHGDYSAFFPAIQMMTGVGLISIWDIEYNYGYIYWCAMTFCYIVILLMYVNFSAAYILEHFNLLKIQKMSIDFFKIIKSKKIAKGSAKRIMDYVKTQWMGNSVSKMLGSDLITSDIPKDLFKVMREAAYADFLRKIPFFSELDDYILTDISILLQEVLIPPNEIVSYAGDLSGTMYMIKDGYCSDVNRNRIFSRGNSLNMVEAILGLPTLQTVVTITHCRLITLKYSQMKTVYAKHLSFEKEVENTINLCRQLTKEYKDEFLLDVDHTWQLIKEERKSFYKFPCHMEINSVEEYEYYVPFDRLTLFWWVRFLLLRTTIIPDGLFIYCWESFRCVFGLLSAIFFNMTTTAMCTPDGCTWRYIRIFLDITAWADIYVRLHVCYYNKDNILVVHPLSTAKHYLTHGFLVDLLGVLPFQVFVSHTNAGMTRWVIVAQSNRVLQVHRYLQLKTQLYFNRLIPHTNLYVFGYIPLMVVAISFAGTIFANLSCDFHPSIRPSINYTRGVFCHKDVWISQSEFAKPITPRVVQMLGTYLASSILTTIGIQGFTLRHYDIGLVTSVTSFIATLSVTYVMSNIISHYSSSSPALLAYQEAMKNLRSFMKVKKVETSLQKQIINHYELKWKRERGKDLHKLIKRFHFPLRQDLLFDVYGTTMYENTHFTDSCKHFYRNVIINASHKFVVKGGKICRVNDITKYINILYSGSVEVIAAGGTVLNTLHAGAMFGNIDGVAYTRQSVNIVAKCHTEMMSVDSEYFYSVLNRYPKLKLYFRKQSALNVFYFPGKPHEAPEEEESSYHHPMVLNPYSVKIRLLIWFVLHSSCYMAVILEIYQFALEEFHLPFLIVQYASDVLFVVYVVIKYHLAYEDDMGNLVTNVRKVRCHHINISKKRWRFYVDLFSLVPWELPVWLIPMRWHTKSILIKYLRINRMTRVLNIIEFFKYNRHRLATNHTYNELEFIFVWSTLLLHTFACALIDLYCYIPNNMIPELKCPESIDTTKKRITVYVHFMYLITNLYTRSAQDHYQPDSWTSAMLMTFLMVAMTITVAIFFSQIFLIIYKSYFTRIVFSNKMDHMNHFLEREEVSTVLIERVHIYLQRLWMRHRGILFPKLLEEAPPYLKEAILVASYAKHINNHPVFSKCHQDLRRQIVSKLRDNIYFPGDYVAFQEDIHECMFFIHKGEIIAVSEDEGQVVKTHKQGQVFGVLQGLSPGVPYRYTYRASVLSVVLSLTYESWSYMLEFFPASQEVINNKINECKDNRETL